MIIAGIQEMNPIDSIRINSPVDLFLGFPGTIQITLVDVRAVDPMQLIIAWDVLITVYMREIQDEVVVP